MEVYSLGLGTNTPMPDPIPLDQCNGHGTHVTVSVEAAPQGPKLLICSMLGYNWSEPGQ